MSDKSLEKLIESIKTEAIESAQKESKYILEDAGANASRVIKEAEDEKKRIIAEAHKEADSIIKSGEGALRQSARDLKVSLRNDLVNLMGSVLERQVDAEFSPDVLKSAIVKVVENIGANVELQFSEDFEKELTAYIHTQLKSTSDLPSMIKGSDLGKGFSVANTDEGWSYQVTPEEVSGLLKELLSSRWVDILENDTKA